MAKDNTQKIQLQFLTCPTCQGQGGLAKKNCPQCGNLGVVAWTGHKLLYWGENIDRQQITRDKLKQIIKNIINLLLILFGILGVVLLGWMFYLMPPWDIYKLKDWRLSIFWLSMLTNCYLFYRFQREVEKIKYIPQRKYQAKTETPRPISPDEIKEMPKREKINIVNYFTPEAKKSINKAWQIAKKYKSARVSPIHFLIALLTFEQTRIIFGRLGISSPALRDKISKALIRQPAGQAGAPIRIDDKVKEIIFQSYYLAYQLRQKKVELTELIETLTSPQNEVTELLYGLNITTDKVINVIAWLRIQKQLRTNWQHLRRRAALKPKNTMNRSMTAIATPVLDAFSQDLTLLARAGYLAPCVGREKEIEEIFNIMHGGTRRSVILSGRPGVGKNTIIEGIAQKMVEENIPDFLRDKRLVGLSIAKLTSGATPTQAQKRLMLIINEVRRSGNIILSISNIHNITGITAGQQGSIDLADVLAQALSNNSILCLTTTTPEKYRRHIESKSSLDNTLEKVEIKEVSGNEAIQILESKIGSIEHQNQVFFSYDAVAETVKLSNRYLHERYLPEKAIEILQEVATRVRRQRGKNNVITADDIALLISEKTNIPLAKITQEESEKLLNLEDRIHQRMINQQEAVDIVASSLRRARAEMRDASRPIVNLLFLGPTGVGKTELAKTVAEVYFGNEKNMIRLDMSEYQNKASVSRLIGAPPGSADAAEGGYLAEAVRKNPFSLILLDEIEKADPSILNVFLQIMDDGRLTDNMGRTIDFTNVILIATSNANTRFIQKKVRENISLAEIKKQLIDQELNQYFQPEFLNRFDGIVVFKPLSRKDIEDIAGLMLEKVKKNLEEKGINLKIMPEAITDLVKSGYNPDFGARPLRRVIQKKIQDPLANYLLAGQIGRQDTVIVGADCKISIAKAKQI